MILAGGSGSRLGANIPKQFLNVRGKMVIEYTLEAFDSHPGIDEIYIVCHADYTGLMRETARSLSKPVKVLAGGRERTDSTLAALRECEGLGDECRLLFHDSVRPMVTHRIISDCIRALDDADAVNTVVPCTDTIIEVTQDGAMAGTPPRAMLRCVQTPQGFRPSILRRAYEAALADPSFSATDDCGVVFRYLPEVAISLVSGDPSNIKLTYPSDLQLLSTLLSPAPSGK